MMQRRVFIGASLALGLAGCSRPSTPAVPAAPAAAASGAPPRPMPVIKSSAQPSVGSEPDASKAQGAELAALYETVSRQMYGFVVGNTQSPRTVHVVFDPQCPHCGRLWVQSAPLWERLRFVWLPVPLLRPESMTTGALIMASPNPAETMNVHEHKLLSNDTPLTPVPELVERGRPQMQHNADVANRIRLDSVPFILHQRPTGEIVSTVGGIGAPEVLLLLGS